MARYESVLDLIGNTPMVDVSRLSPNPRVAIVAKLEIRQPWWLGQGPSVESHGGGGGERRDPRRPASRSSSHPRVTRGSLWP